MRPIFALVPCVLLALAAPAAAETFKVPAQFATIGAAVAAAQGGDTVLVSKGVYLETLVVAVPNLKLIGKKAVIDARFGGSCISVTVPGVTISGFTLVNGSAGLQASVDSISVTKCVVSTCAEEGLFIESGAATISGNTVTGCGEAGISFAHHNVGHAVLDKNVCTGNAGAGIDAVGDDTEFTRNRCEGNGDSGFDVIVDSLSLEGGLPLDQPVLFEKNDCSGNGGKGIDLFNATGSIVTLTGNVCTGNGAEGLFLNSVGLVVEGNRCEGNLQDGMLLLTNDAHIMGNTASRNRGNGMVISGDSVPADGNSGTTADANHIEANKADGNTGDGFVLLAGQVNVLDFNKASGNGDDGLDIESSGCIDTFVGSNNFSSNGHEGIDNGGVNTDIVDNTCRKNSHGLGPDIAAKGSFGFGSVDQFDGNSFDTGGELAAALMDNYGNTEP